jgi:alkanesulfonate monooxygenase SsuD/methylene tetrahydromethanopterin reductase-like flavin-dependent oxidoreductase (luciferase family)
MPIMMGARGPRMLRLAARQADIIGVLPGDDGPEGLGKQMAVIREAAGDRYDSIEFTRLHFDVQVDGKPERTQAGRGPSLVGSVDEVVEQLQKLREEYDVSYIMVIGPQIDAFAPVVARLAGT